MELGQVEVPFMSLGHCGPVVKNSWRSMKIWPSYDGLKLSEPIIGSGG